jgi:hypothetical protein
MVMGGCYAIVGNKSRQYLRIDRTKKAMRIARTTFAFVLGVVFLFAVAAQTAKADTVLVGALNPSGSYYGMCCNDNTSLAAEFTLSQSKYVTTIDVVLESSSIFDFSLQNSLTGSITTFASTVITTPTAGQNTEAITVDKTLPADTYYLVGTEDPASSTLVPGWFVSDGTFVTNAGSVTNGVWFSESGPGGPWAFSSGVIDGYTYDAPTFVVNGSAVTPDIEASVHGCHVRGSVKQVAKPRLFKIVVYAYTNEYYIQPCDVGHFIPVNANRTWGPIRSHDGNIFALLVARAFNPELITSSLPP